MKKDKQVSILIPSRGSCPIEFANSYRLMAIPKMFKTYQSLSVGGCEIGMQRNQLIQASAGDSILCLDDDLIIPGNALVKLAEHNKDIICGLYFAKQQPHFPQIFKKNKDGKTYDSIWEIKGDDLIEIDGCGAGFLLVKRKVFDKIGTPYFKTLVDENGNRELGEDLFFCQRAKEAGFKIYCDPTVLLKHIGSTYIGQEYWHISLNRLKEMEIEMGEEEFQRFLESKRN